MNNNKDVIVIKAKITMKSTENGGRKSGFVSGYRPNHVFEAPEDLGTLITYIGDIIFDDDTLFEPVQTKIVTVRFLYTPLIEKYITVGQKWFINEGINAMGIGEIIEV